MICLVVIRYRREDGDYTFHRETKLGLVIYVVGYQLLGYGKHPAKTSARS